MTELAKLKQALIRAADPRQVEGLQRFFKTAPGEYGAGDVFLGLKIPQIRMIVRDYLKLSYSDLDNLLSSKYHEFRLAALFILVKQYQVASKEPEQIVNFYLSKLPRVNNWDLVDLSAPYILGDYLLNKPALRKSLLSKLANSEILWERRVAIVACYPLIKAGSTLEIFKLTKQLAGDQEDLIHKALGWMLREVGKQISEEVLKEFLRAQYSKLARTTLRYAIERFKEGERLWYLRGDF